MTAPLSPAAQAVLDAAFPAYDDETLYVATGEQHAGKIAAAALRAAADQVVPEWEQPSWEYELVMGNWQESDRIRRQLLTLATELEAQ
jgi:hypothetical protein